MAENLMFSLNRVMPFFLLILLGYGLKRFGAVSEVFLSSVNRYVYRVALPLNLFLSTATMDLSGDIQPRFLISAFVLTVAAAFLLWGITELLFKEKRIVGTLVQGAFRSNYALLGIPLATSVVGESAVAPAAVALAVIVPTYNILSIIVLLARGNSEEKSNIKKVLIGVVTTPLIIGAFLGIAYSACRLPLPQMIHQTMDYVAGTATPLGLLAIGGLFNKEAATARIKPALYSSTIKIVLLPVVMVAITFLMGFRGTELFLYFVMFGAPVAVSSYSMAAELGGDEPLASNILIITTLFSSLTLSLGIYFMRTAGWI